MEVILLNQEETLLIERAHAPAKINGYLTRLSLAEGEGVRLTHLATGETHFFACHPRYLLSPAPPVYLWKGGETLFLYVRVLGEGGAGHKTEEGATLSPLGRFPHTARRALKNGNALYRFTPEQNASRGGAAALISPQGKTLFYGLTDELVIEEDRFTVLRRFPTHRAHETVTVRRTDTGEVLSYRAYPTRHRAPDLLPPALTPVLFMEEVIFRACPEDFLCRALHRRRGDFFTFFEETVFVLPYAEGVLIFTAQGGVERAVFSVREGLIYDVAVEDLPADFVFEN